MRPFLVYLLHCSDGTYFAGHTDDLDARLFQHQKSDEGYVATRKPFRLVWQGEFETREGAIAFEQQIKGWSRGKKEALIAGDWERIQELARGRVKGEGGASTSSARTDEEIPVASNTVRPEPVEGLAANRTEASTSSARTGMECQAAEQQTVRPELVEGLGLRAGASTGSARTVVFGQKNFKLKHSRQASRAKRQA